jgi:hypothetical protein
MPFSLDDTSLWGLGGLWAGRGEGGGERERTGDSCFA